MRELPLPEEFVSLVEDGIETVRDLLGKGDGELSPIVLVGSTARDEIYPMELEGDADQFPDQIRRATARVGADFIFTIMVGLALDPDHARDYYTIVDRYGSLADSPYAIEAIYFQLETHAGTWRALVPLTISKRKKTFGEVRMHMETDAQGLFTGLLPQPRGSALH